MNNATDLLCLDYRIVAKQKVYNKSDIDNATRYYKQELYRMFDGRTVGKIVFLWTNELFHIVSILRASWEMGCTVFAADYNPYYSGIPEFKDFHEFIDLVIGHDSTHVNNSQLILNHKPHLYIEKFKPTQTYELVDYVLDQPIDGRTNAVTTHTSGTTGFPKLTHYSHSLVIDIARSEVEMNRIDSSETSGHVKTLHHGSLFLNYAIPLLSVCQEHHCLHNMFQNAGTDPVACLKVLLDYVDQHSLTRLMVPYNWIRYMSDMEPIDLAQRVTLNSIVGPTDAEMQKIFDRFNPKQIINMWGCTEVGSVFHSITTKDNIGSYNPCKFEVINKDIDYTINDDHIMLKWKTSDVWFKIADQFKVFPDHLLWLGRSVTITIDDRVVNIGLIKEFLEQYYDTVHFSIVADYEMNCLYLAAWDSAIPNDLSVLNTLLSHKFGPSYRFDQVKQLNYFDMLQGMKPSQPILLYMFRNNEQTS